MKDCMNCEEYFTAADTDRPFAYVMCDECYEEFNEKQKDREVEAYQQIVISQKNDQLSWLTQNSVMYRLYNIIKVKGSFTDAQAFSIALDTKDWSVIAQIIELMLGLKKEQD